MDKVTKAMVDKIIHKLGFEDVRTIVFLLMLEDKDISGEEILEYYNLIMD